jgi:dCTP deaminase
MIEPFQDRLISEENGRRLLSYGLSSYGYDIRLSPKQCLVFGRVQTGDCDPKNFDTNILKPSELRFKPVEAKTPVLPDPEVSFQPMAQSSPIYDSNPVTGDKSIVV